MDWTEHLLTWKPNGSVDLGTDRARLRLGSDEVDAEITLSLDLLPKPTFGFSLRDDGQLSSDALSAVLSGASAELELAPGSGAAQVSVSQMTLGAEAEISGRLLNGTLHQGRGGECADVVFHLLNFPDVLSQPSPGKLQPGIALNADGYRVEIVPVPDSAKLSKRLRSEGGYAVTHWGRVSCLDGGSLTRERSLEVLRCVAHFLSFARGAWTGVCLPTAIDADGEVLWRDLSHRAVDRWKGVVTWLDLHNGQVLSDLYQAFWARWQEDDWREVIRTALYWYLRSNGPGGGVDGGVILTQATLERLAWVTLVERGGLLSEAGFERLPAADCLRIHLSRLEVDLAIPASLEELSALGREFGWDGPKAVTEIRNNLVHPGRKKGRLTGRKLPYAEVWTLGQWYLELSLLHMFDFRGPYNDRTRGSVWPGDAVLAPWEVSG